MKPVIIPVQARQLSQEESMDAVSSKEKPESNVSERAEEKKVDNPFVDSSLSVLNNHPVQTTNQNEEIERDRIVTFSKQDG